MTAGGAREVIVVGAGVGGLSAAIACAARGHRVTILEAAGEPGGKAGRVQSLGETLDTGPSVLTLPHVFDQVLALAGEPGLEVVRPERWFRYRFADGSSFEAGGGLERTIESVRAGLGRDAADDLARFLDSARRAWEIAAPRFVFGPAPGLRALASARPGELRALQPFTTLWQWIERTVRDERLRALLARFATYAGSDARRAPAVLGTIAWVELGLGGFGVRGGIFRLVDRLVAAGRRLGVELRLSAEVSAIEVARGRVRGVRLASGERLAADAVVCNAEARALFEALLPAPLRRPLRGESSFSGRCLLLRTPAADRPAHEVLFPARYFDELDDLQSGREVRDPTLTISAPRIAHAAAAAGAAHRDAVAAGDAAGWAGDEALFVMVNAPARGRGPGPATPSVDEEAPGAEDGFARAVRDRLARLGLCAPSAECLWTRGPAALARRFPGSGGALYGFASHSWSSAFQRPKNRVRAVGGLYLAGGSAHPGAGLPLVAASGMRAAEALEEDLARERRSGPRRGVVAALALLCFALPCFALPASGGAAATPARPGGAPIRPSAALGRVPEPAEDRAVERASRLLASVERVPGAAGEALALVEGGRSPPALVAAAEAAYRVASAAPPALRRSSFEEAVARARLAVRLAPASGGAWFWLALAVAADSRERGVLALLRHAGEIRDALHAAARLDPGYERGAPLSGLCGLYHRAPGWPLSYGDDGRARGYCRAALAFDPRSWEAHLVLAAQARGDGDLPAARAHLAAILDGPLDPRLPRTHARYRADARELLRELP